MYYEDRFKELLITTAKGFGIGLVISVILTALIGAGGVGEFIGVVIAFTIVFGSIVSIIICSRSGAQGYMSSAVGHLWSGIKGLFFGSLLGGNVFLLVFGIIKLFIGIIIMIPVGIFMALSYFFNLFYLGIMCLLEKKNKLDDKAELCETLDKLSPVLAGIVTVIFCIMIIKGM